MDGSLAVEAGLQGPKKPRKSNKLNYQVRLGSVCEFFSKLNSTSRKNAARLSMANRNDAASVDFLLSTLSQPPRNVFRVTLTDLKHGRDACIFQRRFVIAVN